jgi:hypothetical protein
VRLNLTPIPWLLAERLRRSYPDLIGGDGALYLYGIGSSSQQRNRDDALIELAQLLATLQSITMR